MRTRKGYDDDGEKAATVATFAYWPLLLPNPGMPIAHNKEATQNTEVASEYIGLIVIPNILKLMLVSLPSPPVAKRVNIIL